MRTEIVTFEDGKSIAIVALSRRNLLSLLAKLDGFPSGSACMLERVEPDGTMLTLTAEEDDVHYGERRPGPMHPDTEEYISKGGSA